MRRKVCPECSGHGIVRRWANDPLARDPSVAVCPRCDGRQTVADRRIGCLWLPLLAVVLLTTALSSPEAAGGSSGPGNRETLAGVASWYCGAGSPCTRGYSPTDPVGAAGPALRVGDWRGRWVVICAAAACTPVVLVDTCRCPGRLIDLARASFADLAAPSRGLVQVTLGHISVMPVRAPTTRITNPTTRVT